MAAAADGACGKRAKLDSRVRVGDYGGCSTVSPCPLIALVVPWPNSLILPSPQTLLSRPAASWTIPAQDSFRAWIDPQLPPRFVQVSSSPLQRPPSGRWAEAEGLRTDSMRLHVHPNGSSPAYDHAAGSVRRTRSVGDPPPLPTSAASRAARVTEAVLLAIQSAQGKDDEPLQGA